MVEFHSFMNDGFELQANKKALQINLDPRAYGTFAEIGAGQEVARRFFHVGGAAGTVAKTMSAYDMTFSDAIYGCSSRYVSRQRLNTMLDHEYELLIERLAIKFGQERCFFVFANTVAARSFRGHEESHGWLGIRFQPHPMAPTSEIIIHVRMLDAENFQQQEALGIIGVNLIYGAIYLRDKPEALIASLLDDLKPTRMEVDMIQFAGAEFSNVDNRIMSLQLVTGGLTRAAMFLSDGSTIQASDIFHKRSLIVERGSFRPLTLVTKDIIERSLAMFLEEEPTNQEQPQVIMEITMQNLLRSGSLDLQDFLDRVDMLGALGYTVLISNYGEYYRLVDYLTRYTDQKIRLPLGIPAMKGIFDEKYYTHLDGGILEGLGRLFKQGVQLYVFPQQEPNGTITTAETFCVANNLRHLYTHLLQNEFIKPATGFSQELLSISSAQVLEKIRLQDPSWKTMVPQEVSQIITERHLFGWQKNGSRNQASEVRSQNEKSREDLR